MSNDQSSKAIQKSSSKMFYFKITPSKNAFQNFCFKNTLQNCSFKKCISKLLIQKYTSKLLPQKIYFKTFISKIHFIAPSKNAFQNCYLSSIVTEGFRTLLFFILFYFIFAQILKRKKKINPTLNKPKTF